MRIKLLMILGLLLMGNCSEIYAEEQTFLIMPQAKDESRDFLDVFTEEEKCVVLAFEHQLDTFELFYSYHHTFGGVQTSSDVSLWDVGSLYWNYEKKTLDEFLDYICKPILEKRTNMGKNVKTFKEKVKKDYVFVRKMRKKQQEKELKFKKEDEFFIFVYRMYEKIMKSSRGRGYFKRLELKMYEEN